MPNENSHCEKVNRNGNAIVKKPLFFDQLEEQLEEVMVAPNPDYQKKSQSETPSYTYFGSFERTLELAYRLNMGLTHKAITRIAAKIRPNKNTYNENI